MNASHSFSHCAGCPLSRRDFLTRAGAATAGAVATLAAPRWGEAAEPKRKLRIRIVYALHGDTQTGPDWPNKGFDFRRS